MLQEFHGFPVTDFDIQQETLENGLLQVKITHTPTGVVEIHRYKEDAHPLMAELQTFLSLIGCLESITSVQTPDCHSRMTH